MAALTLPPWLQLGAATVLAAGLGSSSRIAPLAGHLRDRMELVYLSDGVPQPPWTVDSVRLGVAGLAGADCALAHFRRNPSLKGEAERFCLTHDTLYRWSRPEDRWEISRPVGSHMRWTTLRPNGDTVHYETGPTDREAIGELAVDVVHTLVTTVDSSGRPKSRLRERYALSLLTATGGVFERPDSAGAGAWKPRSTFELKEVRSPRQ